MTKSEMDLQACSAETSSTRRTYSRAATTEMPGVRQGIPGDSSFVAIRRRSVLRIDGLARPRPEIAHLKGLP